MHEKIWAQFSERQYLWAKYIWCMFDFASDGRQEGDTKGQNDKGLVTRERVEKDAFYFYKSVWNDEPMLHISEKRFTNRPQMCLWQRYTQMPRKLSFCKRCFLRYNRKTEPRSALFYRVYLGEYFS